MKKLTFATLGLTTTTVALLALFNCGDSPPAGNDPVDLSTTEDLPTTQDLDEPDLSGAKPPTKLTGFQQPASAHWDATTNAWYVTNVVASQLTDPRNFRDNKAFISKVPADLSAANHNFYPETAAQKLSAPFGMRAAGGKLYVGDIDKLWAIDLANPTGVAPIQSAQVAAKGMAGLMGYPAFLLDVAVDGGGNIFVADATGRRVIKFAAPFAANAKETQIIAPDTLAGPSGLYVDGARLVIAEAGINQVISQKGGISTCGLDGSNLKRLLNSAKDSLAFQGIEKDGGQYMVGSPGDKMVYSVDATTGVQAIVRNVSKDGATTATDLGWDPVGRVLAVPDSGANTVYFYKL